MTTFLVNPLTTKRFQNLTTVVYGGLLTNSSVEWFRRPPRSPFSPHYGLWEIRMAGLSSLLSSLRVPLMTIHSSAFSLSEQQPAEIRPSSIEVAWPVTAGLGVRGLRS
ncbi:hypothetical protein AVEN_38367-1 [Araneus ventricosus]|uniref:Uncharacterized protein n=1 Tax=Araneus ventricosus TaxID=182803 RepID=A0A4Y2J6P1_ARAVE|nr:hypothetical protein AVEN_38367-1 [Araneus ventricosus]